MPRTPLFGLLRRAYRLASISTRTGIPADELIDLARERRGVNRREFLALSGAAAGAAVLGGCASVPMVGGGKPRDPQVIIVGAGLAGLTAAHRLHEVGVRVHVLEAQTRVGGRCFSIRNHFADGQVAELGGELIDTPHERIRALLDEFGIPLDDLAQEEPGLTTETWFFEGRRRTAAEVAQAFAPLIPKVDAARALAGDGVSYRSPGRAADLDRTTLEAWFTQAGVTGWFRRLLDVAYTTEFGLEPGEQSALNFVTLIGTNPESFDIFGESDERFHVRGGNDRVVRALASRLGSTIETGTIVEAVRTRADGAIELSVSRGGTAATLAAPHVLMAVPFTLMRRMTIEVELPPAKRRAIDELGYGTNAKLMVGFDARPWRTEGLSNGSVLTDLPFQLCWETSRAQAGQAGILTNFTGGRYGVSLGQDTPGEQAHRFVGHLAGVFPSVAGARFRNREARFHWPSHEWTRGSYACYRPGQWTTVRGAERERVGNLLFAGEHCSAEFQGFMEGAVETGEAAAVDILRDFGVRVPSTAGRRVRRTSAA